MEKMKDKKSYFCKLLETISTVAFGCILLVTFSNTAFSQANTDTTLTQEETVAVLISLAGGFLSKVTHPDGVCIYAEADFQGSERLCFTSSQASLPASWEGQISSISVSSSYSAEIFTEVSFDGASKFLDTNAKELGTLDNAVASITINAKDDDRDGIINSADSCPNTALNNPVKSNGCASSQLDSDQDGINDAFDRCSETPPGAPIDSSGCSLDADLDGVADIDDFCADTSAGEVVNEFGCSSNQVPGGTADFQCIDPATGEGGTDPSCPPEQRDSDYDGIVDVQDPYPLQSSTQCFAN